MSADFFLMAFHRHHDERTKDEKKEAFDSDGTDFDTMVPANLAFRRFFSPGLLLRRSVRFFSFFDQGFRVFNLRTSHLHADLNAGDAGINRADVLFRDERLDA